MLRDPIGQRIGELQNVRIEAGADGIYVEGPKSRKELAEIGKAFRNVPLATSILERGGKTPWQAPGVLHRMGYDMILYPTTVLFRAVRAMEEGLADLLGGKALPARKSVDLRHFEEIVDMPKWAEIEDRFMKKNGKKGVMEQLKHSLVGQKSSF